MNGYLKYDILAPHTIITRSFDTMVSNVILYQSAEFIFEEVQELFGDEEYEGK